MLDDQCRSLSIMEKNHLAGKLTTTDQDSSPPPLSGSSHHSTTRFSPLLIELKVIFQHLYFSSYSLLSFYLLFHLTSFHKLLAVWGGLSSASAHNLVPRLHNFFLECHVRRFVCELGGSHRQCGFNLRAGC